LVSFCRLPPSLQPQVTECEQARHLIETIGGSYVIGMERLAHAGAEMMASKRLVDHKIAPPESKLQQKRSSIEYRLHKQ
jgi:hypothetical protein